MDECYCDYGDPPRVYSLRQRVARKRHKCEECNRLIEPGETYEYVFGVWDYPETIKTCSHCVALRQYVDAHVPCFCWMHGNLIDDALETLREYAHECPGLFTGGARFYIQAKRIRRSQKTWEVR